MAEIKVDELNVTALQAIPPSIDVDELSATAIVPVPGSLDIDRLYARGIAKLGASITVQGIHGGGLRRTTPATRFKVGYKEEILTTLANGLGITLPIDNYDIVLGSEVSGKPGFVNLRLNARKVSGYRRYSDVTYRRAEAAALMPLLDLEVLKPNDLYPLNTTAQIVARINTLFGTKLTDIDFVEEATPAGQDRQLTAKVGSYYFQSGSKISLGRLDANERSTEIAGLAWAEVDRLQLRVAGADFSAQSANLATLTGATLANDVQSTVVVTALNAILGTGHGVTTAFATSGGRGIRGLPIQQLVLPAVSNPLVDNSGFYNRALIVDLDLATGFNFRYLILHYNV